MTVPSKGIHMAGNMHRPGDQRNNHSVSSE